MPKKYTPEEKARILARGNRCGSCSKGSRSIV